MKTSMNLLAVFGICLILSATPASADTIYSNGPTNGNTDAWTINFGFIVSDSFRVTTNDTAITGFTMADWLFPGDTLTSAELSITSLPFGGTTYFNQTVNFTQSSCSINNYGYNICNESSSFSNGPMLNSGTYWINLQNASVPSGDPVYWDENSGPSRARDSGLPVLPTVGTIPSESFTILGGNTTTCICGCSSPGSCDMQGTVPEPGSLLLLGSGMLGVAGLLARKLF